MLTVTVAFVSHGESPRRIHKDRPSPVLPPIINRERFAGEKRPREVDAVTDFHSFSTSRRTRSLPDAFSACSLSALDYAILLFPYRFPMSSTRRRRLLPTVFPANRCFAVEFPDKRSRVGRSQSRRSCGNRAQYTHCVYTRAFRVQSSAATLAFRARPVTHIFNRCQPDRKPDAMCSTLRRLATTDRRRAFFYRYSVLHVLRSPTGVSPCGRRFPRDRRRVKRNDFLFTLSTLFRFVTPRRFVRPSGGAPVSKENSGQQQEKNKNYKTKK